MQAMNTRIEQAAESGEKKVKIQLAAQEMKYKIALKVQETLKKDNVYTESQLKIIKMQQLTERNRGRRRIPKTVNNIE
jgi:hypothetical protein